MVCPSVLEKATVDVVVHASSSEEFPIGPDYIELSEQILIALLGNGVLNTEAGGNDIVAPSKEDRAIFESLQTKTVTAFESTRSCPSATLRALEKYAKDVHTYVEQHPTTTKGQSKQHKFSKTTQYMLVQQGTPRVLKDGSAIMVTLGSDLGDTHDDEEAPFFEAGGRSADLVNVLYNNFAYWERSLTSSYNANFTKSTARKHLLPFVDLFPWFVKHKDDYKSASKFVGQYMNATTPYVVLAYGNLVCVTSPQIIHRPIIY
jgi:hypothetical protein